MAVAYMQLLPGLRSRSLAAQADSFRSAQTSMIKVFVSYIQVGHAAKPLRFGSVRLPRVLPERPQQAKPNSTHLRS